MQLKKVFSKRPSAVLQIVLLLTLMQLAVTLLTNGFAMQQDEAMWHYIGRNWFRNGLVPYTGGVDNHSPLIFAIFGLSDNLFGINYWFPRILGTICQSIGIYYLYKIAEHVADRRAGILAISFYGLSVLWHGVDGRYVSYTETYPVMFIIIAFYLLISSKNKTGYFISGFFGAIAIGFRLSAFFVVLALFPAMVKKGWKCTLVFIAGILAGIIILAVAGLAAGISLRDVYVYAFADNWGKGSTTDHNFLWRTVQFHTVFFYSEVILFYPFVLVYLFIKKKVDWLFLWAIFAFIGINVVGNYARVDLKELLPALSLMAAFASMQLLTFPKVAMWHIMAVIWLVFSPKIVEPIVNFTRLFTGEYQFAQNYCHEPFIVPDESACRQLGWWVKANTVENEKVFVAGYGAQVQVYSERESPTIYFNATQTAMAKKRFYQDMQSNKADMILVPLFPEYKQYIDADLRQYIDQLLAKDYTFKQCMFNYAVYQIKK